MSGSVAVDRLPTAGSAFAYVLARTNGDTSAYRATIRVSKTGALFVALKKAVSNVESNVSSEVATGITVAPGTRIAFRFRVVGSDLRFRAWDAGGADPGGWQTTGSDSTAELADAGGVGLRVIVGASVPNGPIASTFDDFAVQVP